jgi:hypothetical protein
MLRLCLLIFFELESFLFILLDKELVIWFITSHKKNRIISEKFVVRSNVGHIVWNILTNIQTNLGNLFPKSQLW